jgi:hypothetical protein
MGQLPPTMQILTIHSHKFMISLSILQHMQQCQVIQLLQNCEPNDCLNWQTKMIFWRTFCQEPSDLLLHQDRTTRLQLRWSLQEQQQQPQQ